MEKILKYMNSNELKYVINDLFLKEDNFEEIFNEISKIIGGDIHKIHFYLYFIEAYSKNLNSFLPQFKNYLSYIFQNFSVLASENRFINSYFSEISYKRDFFSKIILNEISQFDSDKIDNQLKSRLISIFISDFYENIQLTEYKIFFKGLFISLLKNDIFLVKTLRISLFKLYKFFGCALGEATEIYYFLIDNGAASLSFYEDDIGFINNMDKDLFISEINKLTKNTYIRFFLEIQRKLDLSEIAKLDKIKPEIRFYLSLILSYKYYKDDEDTKFLEYYLDLISSDSESILKEINKIKDFHYIIDFLIYNKLDIFLNVDFAEMFFRRYFEEQKGINSTEKILNTNEEFFINNYDCILYIVSLDFNKNVESKISDFIFELTYRVLKKLGLKDFIEIVAMAEMGKRHYKMESFKVKEIVDLIYRVPGIKQLNYGDLRILIMFGITNLKYDLDKFLHYIAMSSKGQYMIGRCFGFLYGRLERYEIDRMKQSIFYNTIFPINLIHFIKMKLSKDS